MPCAGLQLQHFPIATQSPNPRKCCIKMPHNGFAALTQDRLQTFFLTESHAHISADSDLAARALLAIPLPAFFR